ncbi:MAG: protein kinase, partial [Planctomycetales bacterium]|nr:protein kinase [Planctomycetales bacterium]
GGWHHLHIGKYKLYDQIGKNELGRTFAAEHAQMNRRVAIRTLASRNTSNPELVQRFLADARQAGALDHRNIIHVYDVDSEADRFYVVTELAEGQDLRQIVADEGPLDQQTTAEYIRQAALGLAHAHERGMVHRNIKPENLLIDRHGVVKIMDMGMGRLSESGIADASTDEVPDARVFQAPEQNQPGGEVDARADIYSLGQTARFLLTGKMPDGVEPEPMTDVASEIASLINQMTNAEPQQRVGSANEVAESLDKWLAENDILDDSVDEIEELEDIETIEPLDELESIESIESVEPLESAATDEPPSDVAPEPAASASSGEISFNFLAADKPASSSENAFTWSPGGSAEKPKDSAPAIQAVPKSKAKPTADTAAAGATVATKQVAAKQAVAAQPKPAATKDDAASPSTNGSGPAANGSGSKLAKARKVAKPLAATASDSAEIVDLSTADAVAESEPAAPGIGLAINTKKSRAKAAPAPAPAPAAARETVATEPNAEEEPAAVKADKKPLPMALIIGGAAIAGVMLLSGIGFGAYLLFAGGGDDEGQVAVANPASVEPVTEKPANPEEEWVDPEAEWNDAEPVAADPAANVDASAAENPGFDTTAVSATGADGSNANNTPAAMADNTAAATPTTTDVVAAEPAAAEPNAGDTTTAATNPPAGGATGNEPTATPPSPNPDAEKPAATPPTPAKENPKPAPKPAPAKKKEPFKEMPVAIDLPVIQEGATPEPAVLGNLYSEPTDICFMTLIGGQHALKGSGEFTMANAESGTAERDWEISFKGAAGQSVIATMSLRDNKLLFVWTDAGIAEPAAPQLMNCRIHMDLNQFAHDLNLRSTTPVEPVAFNLQKSRMSERVNLDTMPDPEYMKVEILGLDGPFPMFTKDPDQPMSATNGTQTLLFGEKPADQLLSVKIDSSVKGKAVELTFALMLKSPGSPRPIAFNAAQLGKMKQQVSASMQANNFKLTQIMEAEKKIKDPQQLNRLGVPAQKQLAEQLAQQLIEMEAGLTKIEEMVQATASGGSVQFRVFYDADGTQIDLARSDIAAAAAEN